MKAIVVALVLIVMLGVVGLPTARCDTAQLEHCREARKYAAIAVTKGEAGDSRGVEEHAKEALSHAKAAREPDRVPEVDKAIERLEATVGNAQMGYAPVAAASAEEAVKYLDAAIKVLGG